MLKVYQLTKSTSLDSDLVCKLIYLDRLVRFYAKFLKTWRTAGVFSNGLIIRVRFMNINKYGYESFTEREFNNDNLNERIDSYKRKITKEFQLRHENTRVQRNKEIHKWKKYIDDAKIQM